MLIDRAADWANLVREARLARGLSQAELARMIGMSRQWVSGFENGKSAIAPLALALEIAAVVDLDVDLTPAAR